MSTLYEADIQVDDKCRGASIDEVNCSEIHAEIIAICSCSWTRRSCKTVFKVMKPQFKVTLSAIERSLDNHSSLRPPTSVYTSAFLYMRFSQSICHISLGSPTRTQTCPARLDGRTSHEVQWLFLLARDICTEIPTVGLGEKSCFKSAPILLTQLQLVSKGGKSSLQPSVSKGDPQQSSHL